MSIFNPLVYSHFFFSSLYFNDYKKDGLSDMEKKKKKELAQLRLQREELQRRENEALQEIQKLESQILKQVSGKKKNSLCVYL